MQHAVPQAPSVAADFRFCAPPLGGVLWERGTVRLLSAQAADWCWMRPRGGGIFAFGGQQQTAVGTEGVCVCVCTSALPSARQRGKAPGTSVGGRKWS
mmetsp:Transcript_35644/g.89595  ORF Transcript_35644/g.89595 Transcript_35644/m.89595 type:complete len:98 (-) Transcript_35644:163-456(-)